MRVLKHRWFYQWAKSEKITKKELSQAARSLNKGLFDANLGGGLYKQRIARSGQGKRKGYRAIVACRRDDRVIFMYGFSKNQQVSIRNDEREAYKKLAKHYLNIPTEKLEELIKLGKLIEV